MNKKKFIENLKKRLVILDENEIIDITNEYESIIDDKVKNGHSEQDAIRDFGNIDELINEILIAYKINPKYNEPNINNNHKIDSFEDMIKKAANFLSDLFKKIMENVKIENITVEFIFEILIKAIILLALLAILRLPFMLISYLMESIFDVFIFPFNRILLVIFNIFVWLLYLVSSILLGIAIFKNNIIKKENDSVSKPSKTEKKTKPEIKDEQPIKNNIFQVIIKFFLYLFVIFPLWCIISGLIIATVLSIYYFIIGIYTIGFIFLFIGLLIILIIFHYSIKNIFQKQERSFVFPTIVGIVFITLGVVFILHWIPNITYLEGKNHRLNYKTTIFDYKIKDNTNIAIENSYKIDFDNNLIIDNNLLDDVVKIEVVYYDKLLDINSTYNNNVITINANTKGHRTGFEIYNEIIEDLKNNDIYNYKNAYNIDIKIKANEKTINKLTKKY